jgi:hypothetical protein
MPSILIEMTEEEFDRQYPLLKNHLNPDAGWVYGEGPGCLFETYGEELEFVRQQDPQTIWTLVDGDDGDQYLLSGFHFVNRIGYLISTLPVPDGIDIQVQIPMESLDDEEVQVIAMQQDATLQPDIRLAAIARRYLGIPTLETGRSDSLDFHHMSVWQLKAALRAAYDARVTTGPLPTPGSGLPTPFDAYEIHGMKRLSSCQGQEEEPVGQVVDSCEQVPGGILVPLRPHPRPGTRMHRRFCYPPARRGRVCQDHRPALYRTAHDRRRCKTMTNDPDDILDGLFHACAFAAFLAEAQAQQGWPDMEATRRRAFAYYEQDLAVKNRQRR